MQAMDAIRASKGAEEARRHAATLQRLTAATRASMEQHVRAEEQEVCLLNPPLLTHIHPAPTSAWLAWRSDSRSCTQEMTRPAHADLVCSAWVIVVLSESAA